MEAVDGQVFWVGSYALESAFHLHSALLMHSKNLPDFNADHGNGGPPCFCSSMQQSCFPKSAAVSSRLSHQGSLNWMAHACHLHSCLPWHTRWEVPRVVTSMVLPGTEVTFMHTSGVLSADSSGGGRNPSDCHLFLVDETWPWLADPMELVAVHLMSPGTRQTLPNLAVFCEHIPNTSLFQQVAVNCGDGDTSSCIQLTPPGWHCHTCGRGSPEQPPPDKAWLLVRVPAVQEPVFSPLPQCPHCGCKSGSSQKTASHRLHRARPHLVWARQWAAHRGLARQRRLRSCPRVGFPTAETCGAARETAEQGRQCKHQADKWIQWSE